MSELGARNPAVQQLRRLSRRRSARAAADRFVIDGPVLVREAMHAGIALDAVYADAAQQDDPAVASVIDELIETGVSVQWLADGVLARTVDTVTPHGMAAVAHRRPVSLTSITAEARGDGGFVIVLAGVSDPGNAGTLLRSAEAAGATAVVATEGSVDLFGPKTVRASAGALFHVPVVVDEPATSALEALRQAGYACLATVARGGHDYDTADLTGSVAFVLGNEAHGLDPALTSALDGQLTIPMVGRAESLNVAMAGTVLCFEAARQRRAARE